MAVFQAEVIVHAGANQALAKTTFAEYEIPDEIIREYRSFVETGFAAVLAKAAQVILKDSDVTGLIAAMPVTVNNLLKNGEC